MKLVIMFVLSSMVSNSAFAECKDVEKVKDTFFKECHASKEGRFFREKGRFTTNEETEQIKKLCSCVKSTVNFQDVLKAKKDTGVDYVSDKCWFNEKYVDAVIKAATNQGHCNP